jgi:hypothetical protein
MTQEYKPRKRSTSADPCSVCFRYRTAYGSPPSRGRQRRGGRPSTSAHRLVREFVRPASGNIAIVV